MKDTLNGINWLALLNGIFAVPLQDVSLEVGSGGSLSRIRQGTLQRWAVLRREVSRIETQPSPTNDDATAKAIFLPRVNLTQKFGGSQGHPGQSTIPVKTDYVDLFEDNSECKRAFNGLYLLHLFSHRSFKSVASRESSGDRLPRSTGNDALLPMAAVSFVGLGGSFCLNHYGHVVQNVVLSIYKHFIQDADQTWQMLGFGSSHKLNRPKLFLPQVGLALSSNISEWFPELEIEFVQWVPQLGNEHCSAKARGALGSKKMMLLVDSPCKKLPAALHGRLPWVQLSSDSFPSTRKRQGDSGCDGWQCLADHDVLLEGMKATVQDLRTYLRTGCQRFTSDSALGRHRNTTLMIERRPDTTTNVRSISNWQSLVRAAREFASLANVEVVSESFEHASFEKQCRLFSSASMLVGQHGAGLTNCVFLPDGARVLEIAQPARHFCELLCSHLLPFRYYMMHPSAHRAVSYMDSEVPLEVDLETFKQGLRLAVSNDEG